MLTIPQSVSSVELLLRILYTQYLADSYCLVTVSELPFDLTFSSTFLYIDPNKGDLSEKLLKALEDGCSDYIVRMENPQLFISAFDAANSLGLMRRSDKKLIFLPCFGDNYTNNVLDMLSMSECSSVANFLLILTETEENCDVFNLLTHKFVGSDSEIDQPLVLDRWRSCTRKFDKNVNLFPHDMTDMMGKTLRVSCFTYKPYVLLDLDTATVPSGRDGIDMRTLDELCRIINCTISINREDKYLWGEIHKNHSGIGIMGSIVENRADMGITGLFSWYDAWKDVDYSVYCLTVAVTCLVPAPRLVASWQIPLLPFSTFMWLAVIITLIYGSIGLYLARKGSSDKILLTVFGIMITQSQRNVGETWRIRGIIGWLLVTGLIIVSAYGAGLASTFTVPKYEASIDTAQDIVDRDMQWGASHDAWIYSLRLSSEPWVKQLVKQFRVYNFEELQRRTFTRTMGFGVERLPAGTFAIGEYINKETAFDMQLLLEDFYSEQCVIMMRKNSPYSKKVNQLIGVLHQSGLLLAWERQVTLKYMDLNVQLAAKMSREKSDAGHTKPLSITQVEGVFIIYLIGVTTAITLFLGEIFYFYYVLSRKAGTIRVYH